MQKKINGIYPKNAKMGQLREIFPCDYLRERTTEESGCNLTPPPPPTPPPGREDLIITLSFLTPTSPGHGVPRELVQETVGVSLRVLPGALADGVKQTASPQGRLPRLRKAGAKCAARSLPDSLS